MMNAGCRFVAEHDPGNIAIDLSGISYSDYRQLPIEIGEMITAEFRPTTTALADTRRHSPRFKNRSCN